MLEIRNNIKLSTSLEYSPYLATLYSEKYQKGYIETGVDLPLTYNNIIDTSWTAIAGLKFKKKFKQKNNIFGTFGFEHEYISQRFSFIANWCFRFNHCRFK